MRSASSDDVKYGHRLEVLTIPGAVQSMRRGEHEDQVDQPYVNAMSNRSVGKTVKSTLEANTPLSADEQVMLVRLAAMPDSDFDCS